MALLVPIWLARPVLIAKVNTVLAKDANMALYKTCQWLPPGFLIKTGIPS